MEKISIALPEELAEKLKLLPGIEVSLLVSRLVREKLEKLERMRRILSKSRLSEEKAEEISNKINESLSKRYESL